MKVILVTNHTQDGRQYKPGDEVEMSAKDAAWYRSAVMHVRFAQTAIASTPMGKLVKQALGGELDSVKK